MYEICMFVGLFLFNINKWYHCHCFAYLFEKEFLSTLSVILYYLCGCHFCKTSHSLYFCQNMDTIQISSADTLGHPWRSWEAMYGAIHTGLSSSLGFLFLPFPALPSQVSTESQPGETEQSREIQEEKQVGKGETVWDITGKVKLPTLSLYYGNF